MRNMSFALTTPVTGIPAQGALTSVRGARVAHPAPEVRSGGRKVTHRPPHAPGLP